MEAKRVLAGSLGKTSQLKHWPENLDALYLRDYGSHAEPCSQTNRALAESEAEKEVD